MYLTLNNKVIKQAVRLGGCHNMPPPRDFDLEVGVGVACAKMLRIDAFVIGRPRFIQIFSSFKQVFYVTIKRYNTNW